MPDLTMKEAAAMLKLAMKTVYAMAMAGEVLSSKIQGQWCIKRSEFDQRVHSQPRVGGGGGRGE